MNQFPLQKKTVNVINAGAVGSASWTAGTIVGLDTENYIGLAIAYTKGGEAGVNIKVEGTLDVSLGAATSAHNATNWYQLTVASTTGGTTTLTQNVYQMTATGNYTEIIWPLKADGIKVSYEAVTPSGGAGMVSVWLISSWV